MPLARLIHHVLDFCYPGVCANCQAMCEGPSPLCDPCASSLEELIHESACEQCAMPLVVDGSPCPYCLGKGLYPFERVVRLGVFKDPLRNMIHQMKYHHRWPLAEQMVDRLVGLERGQQVLSDAEVLVPVPLHFGRHISRGYNQAEILARQIAKRFKRQRIRVALSAVRTRATPSQTQLRSQSKRHENVRDAFALSDPAQVQGKRVVIVDDVMTTGATLKAVGRTLLEAKPALLSALVLAIADPRGRGFEAI